MVEFISVYTSGISITTTPTAISQAIPTTADGFAPRFVRVLALGPAFIAFGGDAITATDSDILVDQYIDQVFSVSGCTTLSVLEYNAPTLVNIVPLENV